tara:strand:+ start:2626 stop:4950 length:2325 start_codon:yes stop_codon:yes gene_type:complete
MTVTATSTRDDYSASAGQDTFQYTFRALADSDVTVYKNNVIVNPADYTVNNIGAVAGGTFVLDTAASVNDTVSIVLTMPVTRDTNYQENGAFLAQDVNGDFDKIYIGAIQNENAIDRTIRLSDAENVPISMVLPLKDQRRGKFLKFHDTTGAVQVADGTTIGAQYTAGSGLALSAGNQFSNTAPDQTVSLTGAGTTNVTGTYPNFTITGSGTTYTAGSGLSLSGTVFANTAPDQTVALTGGTGISTSGTYPNFTVTNDSPDQTVALTGAGATSIAGTYPNFTISSTDTTYTAGSGISLSAGGAIANTAPDQTVALTGAGTTSVSGTYPNFTITGAGTTYTAGSGLSLSGTEFTNTSPDQTVALTGAGTTTVTGTYPNFTITSTGTSPGYVTLAGNNDFTGNNTFSTEIAANGGIALGDNDKATFGDGDDLEIYHDGSNSIIKDNGTGILKYTSSVSSNQGVVFEIENTDSSIISGSFVSFKDSSGSPPPKIGAMLSTFYIYNTNSGAHTKALEASAGLGVMLYDGPGSLRLQTKTTGINVTGTVEFDGLSGTGPVTITDILDEDNMASNSATALATQQSIKAYVDANAGGGGGIALTDLSATTASPGTTGLAYDNTSGVFTYTPAVAITNNNQLTNGAGYTTNTGTVTPSSTDTFTNKSGAISQWTNDAGYSTNVGDITSVVAGTGLSGGATSGAATLNIDSTVATLTGSQTLTNKALTSPALTTPTIEGGASDWQFSVSGNDLIISYGGTSKAKLDTSGNLTVTGNVTAYGTV